MPCSGLHITKAIAQGGIGADSIVYNDGGSARKWARAGVAELHRTRKHIPRDLISQEEFQGCKSRPDIILYRRRQIRTTPEGQWRTTPAVVTLVEIKYTRDTDPSRTMRDPFTQHSELHKLLRERHPSATTYRTEIHHIGSCRSIIQRVHHTTAGTSWCKRHTSTQHSSQVTKACNPGSA